MKTFSPNGPGIKYIVLPNASNLETIQTDFELIQVVDNPSDDDLFRYS